MDQLYDIYQSLVMQLRGIEIVRKRSLKLRNELPLCLMGISHAYNAKLAMLFKQMNPKDSENLLE